jgi:hypothetical protein
MRDDIHRFAPVAPHWRRLIKACYHADWREEGQAAATRVAIEELKKGLDREFLAEVAQQVRSPELFVPEVVERLCDRPSDPFTSRITTHMKGEAQSGVGVGTIVVHSIEAAMKGCFEAQLRNIDGWLANDQRFRRDRRECMRKLRASCAEVDIASLSSTVAMGAIPVYHPPARVLDVDAGLEMQP